MSIHRDEVASFVWGEDVNPFYIVSPRYVRTSAGIRVLHHLSNILNRLGFPAYMIISPDFEGENVIAPNLISPLLTKRVAEAHFRSGLTPITLYPEVIHGNPFRAPFVARFLGNFPGLLGGPAAFAADEVIVPYSAALAAAVPGAESPLFLPVSDPRVFQPGDGSKPRNLRLVYGDKYRRVEGGHFKPEHRGLIEIKRDCEGQQTLEELVDLLQRAEVLYVYENTALAHEAVLCGCVSILVETGMLTENLAHAELGGLGIVRSDDAESLARAKSELSAARERYLAQVAESVSRVAAFAKRMVERARSVRYESMIEIQWQGAVPDSRQLLPPRHYARRFVSEWRTNGAAPTLRHAFRVASRMLRAHH
jgi:hypothetical protein